MSTQISRRGATASPVKIDDVDHRRAKSENTKREKSVERAAKRRQERRLAARERFSLMDKTERENVALTSIHRACRAYKFKKSLSVAVGCNRIARRWTPSAIFRLYTSLELKAESERQATQLWGEGFEFEPAMPDTKETLHDALPPCAMFENALTESGFLRLARDLNLLALPMATHTGLISIFRENTSKLTKSAALQSRAKGLFAWLCKSSDVQRLGKEDIARLLEALGLPKIAEKDAFAYTYADGTWDFNGFSRHLHHEHWITKVDDDDEQSEKDASAVSSSGGTGTSSSSESLDLASSVSESSAGSLDSADGLADGQAQRTLIGMKKDGFEMAMQELACIVRPAGKSCECEGCITRCAHEAELDGQEATHMGEKITRLRIKVVSKKQHTTWATAQLYFEVLAPSAARLFVTKASAAQDVFGAAWSTPGARKSLCLNEQMLREIFLTLVGRQGDRDALADSTSSPGGAINQPDDDTAVLKGLRADCRTSGFSHVWERAVTVEQGSVGYLEALRFCWDYGLHPGIPNNGEDNFLLAHLFVGASHSYIRVVPDEEEVPSLMNSTGGAPCAKLRCIVEDKLVDNWLADHKLDQVVMNSGHPVLTAMLAQLSVGQGKVSRVKVREFMQELNIGLDRGLPPGELYTIVREIEQSVREAGMGDIITMQICLRSVARACIFSDAVASCRLTYGEFTSLFGALSQLQPGLSPAWCRSALYGITRQNPAAMSVVMEGFMAKIESVHPLLSKDAVRKERTNAISAPNETRRGAFRVSPAPRLPGKGISRQRPSSTKNRRRGAGMMGMSAKIRSSTRAKRGASQHAAKARPLSQTGVSFPGVSGSQATTRSTTKASPGNLTRTRIATFLRRPADASDAAAPSSALGAGGGNASSGPFRPPLASTRMSASGKASSGAMVAARPSTWTNLRAKLSDQNANASSSSSSSEESDSDDQASARRKNEASARRKIVAQDLDAILRSAFDRYAALEIIRPGIPGTSTKGQELSPGSTSRRHDHGNVSAAPTVPETSAGNQMLSAASRLSSARLPSRVSAIALLAGSSPPQSRVSGTTPAAATIELRGAQENNLSGGTSSGSSTGVASQTLSVDGLLLFIGDTNLFPILSFESIAATAAQEVARPKPIATAGEAPNDPEVAETTSGQSGGSAGLNADGFVRVCIQLMRENFLAKELGFYHRVEALTDKQRAQEWEKRHPDISELDGLLQRLRAWMEHYRLPSRMSPFKRDIFAIGCPTETRSPTGEGTLNNRSGGGGTGRQRNRLRTGAIVPHPGPCLIDLWSGQVVARNAEAEDPNPISSSSGKTVKVNDEADRAVLSQIAEMVVDLAVLATPPTTSASTPVVTGNIHDEEGQNRLEPDVGVPSALGGGGSAGTAPPARKHGPENFREAIGCDTDNVNGSDTACSVPASAAGDLPEDTNGKPCLQANEGRPSSGVDRRKCLEKTTSGEEEANEVKNIRDTATPSPLKRQSTSTGLARKAEAVWQGQVTAREVAKKARAHCLQVSNEVVRILDQIRPVNTAPTIMEEGTIDQDGVEGDGDEIGSGSDTSSDGSTGGASGTPAPTLTPDDYTTLPSTHPSQQLLKTGRELMQIKRPEQAVVVLGQSVEMLRRVVKVDPRQSLGGLLELSSTLQKLGRVQDTLPLLLEAQEAARTIACGQERSRLLQNRRLEATVTGVLGWAYIKAGFCERALEAFRHIDKRFDGPTGVKVDRLQTSRARRRKEEPEKQGQDHRRTRQDILLSWEARRGSSTALVGLERGGEALEEAKEAMEVADQLAEPAIRAESEGLLGRAWRGIAAKIGKDAKRQQASAAFDALYDEERPASEPPRDEDKHQQIEERTQRKESDEQQHDVSDHPGGGQDRRDKPHNNENNGDKPPHDSGVAIPEDQGEVPSEVGSKSQNVDSMSTRIRPDSPAGEDRVVGPETAGDLDSYDITSSQRRAAGCFKRQVTLLKSLDRFSSPVPHLQPELDFTVDDDGFSTSDPKTPRTKTTVKTAQSNTQNFHVATLRALLDLGQTELSLWEFDSAVEMFQRRLRLAESRCPRPATPSDAAARHEPPVLQVGARPSTSPRPGKPRLLTRRMLPPGCSNPAGLLRNPVVTPRATDQAEASALDAAEALWWVAVSLGRQHLGIDISSSPRFLPFKLPSRPLSGGHGGVCTIKHHKTTAGGDYVDRMASAATASRESTMVPSRSHVLYKNDEDVIIDVRPHPTPWGGGSTDSTRIHGGQVPISSVPPGTCRRTRPPPRQPKAPPLKFRKHAMYRLPRSAKKRRQPPGSTTCGEPRVGSRAGGSFNKETLPLRRDPDCAGGCSAFVRDESGVSADATFNPGTAPFVAMRPDEEAAGDLMRGGLLWLESGFGRETELAMDGLPQGIAEACRPVMECLRRQLSVALASNLAEGTSPLQLLLRKQEVLRDALMGLGTVAMLCGDDSEGCVLYERAAQCCRSFGDWFGVANAYAAKARLHMATGRFGEAVSGFQLALKLACELRNNTLAASTHSFLGWTIASQGDPKKAQDHFRQWRKKAFRVGDSVSVAASELCVAHMHLRLAHDRSGVDGDDDQSSPPIAPQTDSEYALQKSHLDLVQARRHYCRYLRWAGAMRDPCGISHANACLARVHQAMGDKETSEQHRHASLEQCRRIGDIDAQGKMRAQEQEGIVRDMLQLK